MSTSSQSASNDFSRRSANILPNVWGDHFIQYIYESVRIQELCENKGTCCSAKEALTHEVDAEIMEKHTKMKEKVRKMLAPAEEKASRPLAVANLIDSIQQLGIDYHFEHEIGEVLHHIYNSYVENGITILGEDLHSHALVFRLLRQQGYRISADVFKKFMDHGGKFNEKLINDVEGMISLYEAAYLRNHGEDILDEAIAFTSSNLKLISTQLSHSLQMKVNNCLKRPLRKNIQRLIARNYTSTYEENPSHDEALLLLAKLDFNMVQTQHRKELGYISRWWKALDFTTKLPFTRDRIVEAYYWILGVYFEPQYSLSRVLMTKLVSLLTVIDDIYDTYGTLEELQLFTEAIQRWDNSCMDFLPEYMKVCYKAVLDFYEEIEQEMAKEGRTFSVIYAKNEMIRMVQAYFDEAKWLHSNYIPTMEEYMSVALITGGSRNLTIIGFIGMGNIATEKTFKWLTSSPKIFTATDIISRLMDDIVTNEFDISALDSYMKQHGVTKQEAINELLRQVENAWKDMNEELLEPTQVPKPLLVRVLNLCRIVDVLYKYGDSFNHSGESTKKNIEALLLSPLPV